jgi:Ca2+-binding RTX toxin-like protein
MRRTTLFAIVVALIVALSAGTALAKEFIGTAGPDNLNGTDNADTMFGRMGNDRVAAAGGPDEATGNQGNDAVYGEQGNDTLKGDLGDDFVSGGGGGDTIYGGPDDDRMRGVDGNDNIFAAGDASNRDYVDCGADRDTAHVDSNDIVDGVEADTLVLNSGLSCERLFVNGIEIPKRP